MSLSQNSSRIEVVDALRGFAVLSIMLLHNIEHFDFYYLPETLPDWLKSLDSSVWKTLFFLFAGKSYAIFALLFGFSFFIQLRNQDDKGIDFRARFLWRLFLLFILGIFNSIFYEGDILSFYAIFGLSLLVVSKWNNKAVLITAIILMLQPFEWAKLIYILNYPGYISPENPSNYYFGQSGEYLAGYSFFELVKGNLWNGKMAVIHWTWENGRFFQAPALFMFGMLLGRKGIFIHSESNNKFWKTVLVSSAILFIPLYFLNESLPELITREAFLSGLNLILSSWSNFAFMAVLVSSFLLLYQKKTVKKVLGKLAPFGRMSLTNYITQSVIGSFIYFGYGLGLYAYTGATYSVLIGLGLFVLQLSFCHWWLKNHKQGPFEYLWSRATWIERHKNLNLFPAIKNKG
jgi:uncharacterized protein